jgi:hypothetical protein
MHLEIKNIEEELARLEEQRTYHEVEAQALSGIINYLNEQLGKNCECPDCTKQRQENIDKQIFNKLTGKEVKE